MADAKKVKVRMKSGLFNHCRMSGVLIPAEGEVVALSVADAKALCEYQKGAHAEAVSEKAPEPAPAPAPDNK